MSYILFLNSKQVDLEGMSEIKLTKQVNDIANLSTRQTNFTKQLKIRRTATNEEILEYLGTVGSDTNIPYRKIDADLLDADSGDFLVYKGWAIILSRDETFYQIAIYDGIIDWYKAMDNVPMSQIDLAEVNHFRTIQSITNSILGNLPYKYIIADYNGAATRIGFPNINADYLIPSVKVEWIWNKIFEFLGFTYSGDIFQTDDFKDLWITYPKGTTVGLDQTTPLLDVSSAQSLIYTPGPICRLDLDSFLLTAGSILLDSDGLEYYVCNQDGQIRITNTLSISATYVNGGQGQEQDITTIPTKLGIENRSNNEIYEIPQGQELYIPVSEGDELYFYALPSYLSNYGGWPDYLFGNASFKFDLYQGEQIDFKGAFDKLLIKDFINEILWVLFLTPFKDPYTKNIRFKTFDERILSNDTIDMSHKFVGLKNERYKYSNYAKLNFLRHNYNSTNANYNDGSFVIQDDNLKDSINVIQSKFYTPEFEKEVYIDGDKFIRTYKLWNKESSDKAGTPIKYKALDNRFYFIKYTDVTLSNPVTIESESLEESATFTSLPLERHNGLTFKEIQNKSYSKLGYVLNEIKLDVVQLMLSAQDYRELDFTKKIYIEQLGASFLLNKISDFQKNKVTDVEVLKIKQSELVSGGGPNPNDPITLTFDLNLNSVVPDSYNLDLTNELYQGVLIGSGESITQIEIQAYSGNLYTDEYGDDLVQGQGVLPFGSSLFLHTLNIDNTYDYSVNPRSITLVYHLYMFNSTTQTLFHKYTIIKNITINYSEAWGGSLNYNATQQQGVNITDVFEDNAPLRPGEVFSYIVPIDLGWEQGPQSEFFMGGQDRLEIGALSTFNDQFYLNFYKWDGSYNPPSGYVLGLEIYYELWAYNQNTNTYRLIYNFVGFQITIQY